MKKFLSLLLATLIAVSVFSVSSFAADIAINESNFPDANFRAYVKTLSGGDDNVFTDAELALITTINCNEMQISDLKGIEYFTALNFLSCNNNNLSNIDISKNINLWELQIENNKLTSLDVSNNIGLALLDCLGNKLTSLDVSDNVNNLRYIACHGNLLTSIDVSNNSVLVSLICYNNQITSLITGSTPLATLLCYSNNLSTLDLSGNTEINTCTLSNQTIMLNRTGKSGDWKVQLPDIDYTKVTVTSADATLDIATGIVTFTTDAAPEALTYEFYTDNEMAGSMTVNAVLPVYEKPVASSGIVHQVTEVNRAAEEENPNTGAEAPLGIAAAIILLSVSAAVIKKNK